MSTPQKQPARQIADAASEQQEQSGEAGVSGDSLLEQVLAQTQVAQAQPARRLEKPVGFHPWEISALVNFEVVARHADDAPFLWVLRDRAVAAPHYSLSDLAKLDERVEAHLDGLRVAGEHGWRLAEKALNWKEPGEVFTAAVLALESRDRTRIDPVIGVAAPDESLARGLISAAGWTDFALVRPVLRSWLTSETAALRRTAVAAFAVHRQDPGPALVHRLYDDDPCVRARTLKAVAELGRVNLLPMALHLRSDSDPLCRFRAAGAAVRLGDRSRETIASLQEIAVGSGPCQEHAVALAVRCLGSAEAVDWLRQLWRNPEHLRLAVTGAAALGDPALAGVIIEWIGIEQVARAAGEAFSAMTGADLKFLDLDCDPPPHRDEGDAERDTAEHAVLDVDRDLPFPDQEKIAAWWRNSAGRFVPGRRYLCGAPIEPGSLQGVLLHGKQRQRAAAALELGLLHPAEPLFEVRARGKLQERSLEAWTL
jgi:uncharacterized protein (TIGR02270 family)